MPTSDPNITAKVICDSVNRFHQDCRLTTFVVTYPRIILAELNTHRMLSRSTASSRAIPIVKQIQKVKDMPFVPSWMGKNQSGMQSKEELTGNDLRIAKNMWVSASDPAINYARKLEILGLHKQITNRLLEPWMYVTSIVSATDLGNFFKLRCHQDAQPEFMVLAFRMLEAYLASTPMTTDIHIPFGDQMDHGLTEEQRIMVACARCARISYETHDGKRDHDKDLDLAKSLIKAGHMSPFEHVAKINKFANTYTGNFKGWIQIRKTIKSECAYKPDLKKIMLSKPDWV
jgi:hypothetical protein